jgi:hypothetical protein
MRDGAIIDVEVDWAQSIAQNASVPGVRDRRGVCAERRVVARINLPRLAERLLAG